MAKSPKATKTEPTESAAKECSGQKAGDREVQMDRRWRNRRSESRSGADADSDASEGESPAQQRVFNPPRRKKQRRRQIDPTTCERDYTDEEVRFMRAMDDYKRDSGRMFPTCSEILEVVRSLGYTKLNDEERQLLESIQQVEDELACTAQEAAIASSTEAEVELPEDSLT